MTSLSSKYFQNIFPSGFQELGYFNLLVNFCLPVFAHLHMDGFSIYRPVSLAIAEVQSAVPADTVALFQGIDKRHLLWVAFCVEISPGISMSFQCCSEFVAI